jgi:hypothetical protein
MPDFQYETTWNPPASLVKVICSSFDGSVVLQDCLALLDTGADSTVFPQSIIDQLRILPIQTGLAQGFEGTPIHVNQYLLQVTLPPLSPAHLEVFALTTVQYIVLGRDFLNRYKIVLEGPNLLFSIEERVLQKGITHVCCPLSISSSVLVFVSLRQENAVGRRRSTD